ncbi:MAG TPA: response regulator transcription factor [Acidimicrobiia bacterium]
MIRVVIADDHQLFAEGLSQALAALPDTRVVGTAPSGPDLVALLARQPAEVAIVDLEMAGGDGLQAIRQIGATTPVIVVTMHTQMAAAAAEAGAAAFFSKGVPLAQLAAAIRAVVAGHKLLDLRGEDLSATLADYQQPELDPGAASLTQREIEVLQLLAKGVSSTEELADGLFISQKTVKNHLASIFSKLAVSDRTQAAVEAIRLGLAKPH